MELTTEQFTKASHLIDKVKSIELKDKLTIELNSFAGTSTDDIENRITYDQLSDAGKVIIDNSIN